WADPATLDVLRLLARRVDDSGVVIVVTYRDDELAANPRLGMLVGDLASTPAARRLALRRLSETAVRALAEPVGVDAGELWRLTSGNPFLVAEALAAGGGLPATVRDATLAPGGASRAGAGGARARTGWGRLCAVGASCRACAAGGAGEPLCRVGSCRRGACWGAAGGGVTARAGAAVWEGA